jgi:hypothetical protein
VERQANAPFGLLENTSAKTGTPLNWLLESLNWLLESGFPFTRRYRGFPRARLSWPPKRLAKIEFSFLNVNLMVPDSRQSIFKRVRKTI